MPRASRIVACAAILGLLCLALIAPAPARAEAARKDILVSVTTEMRGTGFAATLKTFVRPLEQRFRDLPDIEAVISETLPGESAFWLIVRTRRDASEIRETVRARIAASLAGRNAADARSQIGMPAGADVPVLFLGFSSETLPLLALTPVVEASLARLAQSRGIRGIKTPGLRSRAITVTLDPARLSAYGLAAADIAAALRAGGLAARPISSTQVSIVPDRGPLPSVEDATALIIKMVDGAPIRLRDLGHAELGLWPPEHDSRLDGRPAIVAAVFRREDMTIEAATRTLREALAPLRAALPPGVAVKAIYTCTRCLEPQRR